MSHRRTYYGAEQAMTTRRNRPAAFGEGLIESPADVPAAIARAKPGQGEEARPAAPASPIDVHAIYDGWPVVVHAPVGPDKIGKYLAKLEAAGFRRPPTPTEYSPNGEPICPKHRVAMLSHAKQGDTWYSHKMLDGKTECWCKGRPGNDSPGWEL